MFNLFYLNFKKKLEENKNHERHERHERREIYSKRLRVKKRTYFFDVKPTRYNDYYLTITESKKRYQESGEFYYEKHKIFLYKEDFENFQEALSECIEYLRNNKNLGSSDSENESKDEKKSDSNNDELSWRE